MRDNMLINPSGLEGHAMEIDKNIEHLIDDLKVCNNYIHTCIVQILTFFLGTICVERNILQLGQARQHFSLHPSYPGPEKARKQVSQSQLSRVDTF
jgi:hypothetical protein